MSNTHRKIETQNDAILWAKQNPHNIVLYEYDVIQAHKCDFSYHLGVGAYFVLTKLSDNGEPLWTNITKIEID